MLSLFEMKRILNPDKVSMPADDFRVLDSWAEYDDSSSKTPEDRNLEYLCYELEVMNPGTGERQHLFKAIKFARVVRLPAWAKQSTSLMDMHQQVLSAVWETNLNMITVISNVIKPVALGLLYLYGIQGVAETVEEAKKRAHYGFNGFIASMQGTYRVLEMRCAQAKETEWLREKMYNMDYLTIVRGIPKASKTGEDAGNRGIGGDNLNPDSQGTLEEIIEGMADYEYVIEILSTPVYRDTLEGWQRRSQRDMTRWNSQLSGQTSISMGVTIPMMYMANASNANGWSKAMTNGNTISHAQGESFSTSQGQSVGESLSRSFGQSVGHTTGRSLSQSFSQGVTNSHGISNSVGTSQTIGNSQNIGMNHSHGTSIGNSMNQNQGFNSGSSMNRSHGSSSNDGFGTNQGVSSNQSHSTSKGTSANFSQGYSDTQSLNQGHTTSNSTSLTHTKGQSLSTNLSESFGRSENLNYGFSRSHSSGRSHGLSANLGEGASLGNGWSLGNNRSHSSSQSSGGSYGYNQGNSESYNGSGSHGKNTGNTHGTGGSFGGGASLSVPFLKNISGSANGSVSNSNGSTAGQSTSSSNGYGVGGSQSATFGRNFGDSASNGYGGSFGLSGNGGRNWSASAGENWGTNESNGWSENYGASEGLSHSYSLGQSVGTSSSTSLGQTSGVSDSLSAGISHGTSTSLSQGLSQGESDSTGYGSSFGQSANHSNGISDSLGTGVSYGNSRSYGTGINFGSSDSYGNSVSYGSSVSNGISRNFGENYSTSQSQTIGQSVGQTASDSVSNSASSGYGQNMGRSQSVSNGNSYTTSNGQTNSSSAGTTGTSSMGTSSSMGLSPNIGFSKSYQWLNQGVQDLLELLQFQNERIKTALRGEGAFYTYVYIACPTLDALSSAQTLAKSTWQNELAMIQPLQVLDLSETEQKHLLYHFTAFSADVTKEDVYGVEEYKYCTVLLPQEYVAYTHLPRISEGGIFSIIQDVPKFSVPSMMKGEIYMGTILNPERYTFKNGYNTQFDYRIDEAALMHGFFTGASRSGKTVAAMRFVAEASKIRRKKTGKRLRIVVLDPKKDWRSLARFVEPERFNFYSMGNPNFHPIKLNPWKVPNGVNPQMWVDGIIDIYCRAYGLLERGKQMIADVVYELYNKEGVFDAADEPDSAERVSELSANVNFKSIYNLMVQKKAELDDPSNKKGRAGNDTRDAYARLIERLSAFGREYSIEAKLYGSSDGLGVDDLIGADDITVFESKGLENTFKNFIFGVITSGFYKYAIAREKGYLSSDQYETVLVIEEANEILTGNDAAGTGGGAQFGLSGESEFEQMLDQAAGYGLFIIAITQKIADMPSSIIANSGLVFIGKLNRPDDVTVAIRAVGREERIDDRDLVKWFPRAPIGWFVCKSSRNFDFKESEPILVHIAPLNIEDISNLELDEVLLEKKIRKRLEVS